MRASGGETVQTPTGEPGWQESLLYIWHDTRAGIAGFHRLGLEPGAGDRGAGEQGTGGPGTGVGNAFCGLFTEDGLRYRWYRPEERDPDGVPGASTCAVGPLVIGLSPESSVTFTDDGVAVSLRFEDLQREVRGELEEGDGGFRETGLASDHYEFTCRVRGSVRIGGRAMEIDALGFRDHSWGVRDWSAIRAHRSCIGTLGPELSWSTLVMSTPELGVTGRGLVLRKGELTMAASVDTVIHLEADGFTHRGGRCVIDLVDGTRLTLDLEVIDAWVYQLREFLSVEGICRIRLDGEPVDGFCLLEASNNPRAGTHLPETCVRAAFAEGLSTSTADQLPAAR